jgi:hypothetical protein
MSTNDRQTRARLARANAGIALALMIAIAPSLTDTAQAHSSKPHPFKSASISWNPGGNRPTPPTLFVGHDGDNYTHLVGEISTRFKIKAKVKSGHRIYGWGVMTADPTPTTAVSHELIGAQGGTYDKSFEKDNVTFTMDATTAVTSGTPGISLTRVKDIVDMCNNAFDVPPSQDQGVGQIELTVHAGFGAGKAKFGYQFVSWTGWYPDDARSRPGIAHTTFPVNVVCLNMTSPRVGKLSPAKPISVDIRVKAKGETCPKDTDVTAYIDYSRPATARFRIIHNGVEPKSAPIEIKAREVSLGGKTWYRVERLERYKLDPGKHSFQIKVLGEKKNGDKTSSVKTVTIDCPPFKVTSAWLSYKVEDKQTCKKKVDEEAVFYANRPGDIPYRIKTQGGLVVTQGIANAQREGDKYVARRPRSLTMGAFNQMMILEVVNDPSVGDQKPLKVECLEVQSGTLDLRAFAASTCKGEAAFSIHTNREGDVRYRLDCTGGRSWSGTAKVHKTGPATYIGVGIKRFDVTNNEQVACALKTREPLPVKVLALGGHKYACHKRAVEPGANGLTVEPRPDTAPPRPPMTLVVPPRASDDFGKVIVSGPRIVCIGGKVKSNTCFCRRTDKPVKVGRNTWRCVKNVVVDPVRPDHGGKAADRASDRRKKAAAAAAAARKAAAAKRRREMAKKAAALRRQKEAAALRRQKSHTGRRAVRAHHSRRPASQRRSFRRAR